MPSFRLTLVREAGGHPIIEKNSDKSSPAVEMNSNHVIMPRSLFPSRSRLAADEQLKECRVF